MIGVSCLLFLTTSTTCVYHIVLNTFLKISGRLGSNLTETFWVQNTTYFSTIYNVYTIWTYIQSIKTKKKRFSFMYPWMLWVDEIVWEWEMKFSQSSSKWTKSAPGPFNKNSLWRHFWNSEYSFSYLCSHTLFVLIISLIFSILSIQFMFYWDLISILR